MKHRILIADHEATQYDFNEVWESIWGKDTELALDIALSVEHFHKLVVKYGWRGETRLREYTNAQAGKTVVDKPEYDLAIVDPEHLDCTGFKSRSLEELQNMMLRGLDGLVMSGVPVILTSKYPLVQYVPKGITVDESTDSSGAGIRFEGRMRPLYTIHLPKPVKTDTFYENVRALVGNHNE